MKITVEARVETKGLTREEAQDVSKALRGEIMEIIPTLPYSNIMLCDVVTR